MGFYVFEWLPPIGDVRRLRCLAGPFETKQEANKHARINGYSSWRPGSHPKLLNPGDIVTYRIRKSIYGHTKEMGPQLRQEVERQLLEDLQFYGVDTSDLHIDWSDTMPEGHATRYLDGRVENWSGIGVVNSENKLVADGWLEFIHKGGNSPLYVFWEFLHILNERSESKLRHRLGAPQHILDKIKLEERN